MSPLVISPLCARPCSAGVILHSVTTTMSQCQPWSIARSHEDTLEANRRLAESSGGMTAFCTKW